MKHFKKSLSSYLSESPNWLVEQLPNKTRRVNFRVRRLTKLFCEHVNHTYPTISLRGNDSCVEYSHFNSVNGTGIPYLFILIFFSLSLFLILNVYGYLGTETPWKQSNPHSQDFIHHQKIVHKTLLLRRRRRHPCFKTSMAAEKCHVMVFPWLAFGHMLPFLELSKKLATNNIKISFVSTPKNLERLPSVPANLSKNINLVEIILPKIEGLPENCEATIDIQQEQTQYLKKAYDNLKSPFEKLLQNDPPQLILIDFAPYWVPEIATKFKVATAFFSVYTAATLAYMGPPDELRQGHKRKFPADFTVAPDWFDFHSLVSHRPDYAPIMLRNLHVPDESGKSSGQRLSMIIEACEFVAIRSCNEFEGEYINLLQKLYQKPVLPVGILPPEKKINNSFVPGWSNTFKWLDTKRPKSVLFVGFGSEYKMPIEQVHELAHGLELSGLSFIWILRKPKGADHVDLLPPSFEACVLNKGVVCLGWAPQMDILAHPSIGGCLFHSGWGSIIESLGFGHPLILMPMVADQGLNGKLLVEQGLGYEVPRNEDGSFTREMVAESVKLVMESREGEPIRAKASQMQTVFCDENLHKNYISLFIQYMFICKPEASREL